MSEFSSFGHSGPEDRPGERYYLNETERPYSEPAELYAAWEDMVNGAQDRPEAAGRVVVRGIASDAVLQELINGPYRDVLEAAVPLGTELGRTGNNLISLGANVPGRQPIVPVEKIIEETSKPRPMQKSPEQRVHDALASGASFTTSLAPEDYDSLYELWGSTFGWVRSEGDDQIADFAARLERDQAQPGPERTIWFAGVKKDGQLVAASMAERKDFMGTDGSPVDLVESTEWAARKGHGGNGYAAAALAVLNSQILSDLAESPNGPPLIFAECNFMSRADLTGSKAGMAIPSREYASQVLQQNVVVDDGKEPAGYRDFNFMILPHDVRQTQYTPEQTGRILHMVNS